MSARSFHGLRAFGLALLVLHLCPTAPTGGRAVGGLMHACQTLTRPSDDDIVRVGRRNGTVMGLAQTPSLRELCAPRNGPVLPEVIAAPAMSQRL